MSSQPPYGYPGGQQGYQGGGYPPPQGTPPGKTKTLNLEYNTAALLCYIPGCCCLINLIPCIIWLATEPKENKLLRFHAIQGLLLTVIGIVCWILVRIISLILGVGLSAVPGSGGGSLAYAGGALILLLVQLVVGVGLLIVHIIGMVKANQGVMWKLPIIGDIADKNS
jgi:uncharacterized membrane protein